MCAPCQFCSNLWQSYVRNTNSKGSKRLALEMSSSWISCDMISPSIMAKLLAKTKAAWWGCFGPTRGRISDDKCSRNARWTISYETKSSLLSLVFSWMWLLSELHAVAHLSFYQLWPSDDLLTPPAIEAQLDTNSPRICRKSVWRIFSQRNAQQEGTALKLYFGQMVRQWGRQIG